MGIVFGKSRNHVKVLTIKETQSLPEIRLQRKLPEPVRSTSYQTTLPDLPNLVLSSDEEQIVPYIPMCALSIPPIHQRHRYTSPQVVAELSSDEYSSCIENIDVLEREKTVLMQEEVT